MTQKLPPGFRIESWSTGAGKTFRVLEIESDNRLISGAKTPAKAIELFFKYYPEHKPPPPLGDGSAPEILAHFTQP